MATPVYIKPSSVKGIIPPPVSTPPKNINTELSNVKQQYGNMSTEQLYSAMLDVKPPAENDILNAVGTQYGYNDRLAGLRQQAGEIQKKMLGDQSALFSATNPDGTAVDPRVKVAQYQENLTNSTQRLAQIQKVQDVYKSEMQTLAGALSDQYKAKAQDTQTAIQFMQQLNQEKNADRSFGLQQDQFNWQKEQAQKPEWAMDTYGNTYDKNSSVRPDQQEQYSNTVDFIKGKEGFRNNAYLDSAGVPTIGYGFTSVNGKKVQMGDTIDQSTADQQFTKQLANYQNWKSYIDPKKLSQEQQTALTSFEYNLGSGIWKQDAMPILQKLQYGDIAGAQKYMKQYTNAGGKFVQGLANRRDSEANLLSKKLDGTTQYIPQNDPNLIEVLDNKFFDKSTGKSISGEEANTMYGGNTNSSSKTYTSDQSNVLTMLSGRPYGPTQEDMKLLHQNHMTLQDMANWKTDGQYGDSKALNLLSQYSTASKAQKGTFKSQLINSGVDAGLIDPAVAGKTYLDNQTPVAFDHLGMLKDSIKKIPDTGSPLTQGIANTVLDWFGSDTPTNAQIMTNLFGDELSKFYNGGGGALADREGMKNMLMKKSVGQILGGLQTEAQAAADQAIENNDKYSAVTQQDHPVYTSIMESLKRDGFNVNDPHKSGSNSSQPASIPGMPTGRFQLQSGTAGGAGRWQQSN